MDGEGLRISIDSLLDCELMSVDGELDCLSSEAFSHELAELEALKRPIVIDLSGLQFLDSSGLHALLNKGRDGVPRALVCPEGNVSRVLAIVRAETAVPVYTRLEEALATARAAANGAADSHAWLRRRGA